MVTATTTATSSTGGSSGTSSIASSTRRQALARLSLKGKLYQKGSSTDALLKRVRQVRTELSEMDQDAVDVNSLKDVCKELVTPALMLHKDKAVKANVACCLADMLRLFAPNAPFTPAELGDIFQFFLHQLTMPAAGLSKPNGPQYAEYFYLLESLSNVKSVVLVCDLANADEIMTDYFKRFLDLARPDMSKNVEICMADVLVQLIDECVSLPSEVLDLLLANFTTKAIKHNPAAHRLAVEVCSNTKDRLQKNVAQYFNEVMIAASQEDDQDERLESLQSAHSLIVQINRFVPSLLLNVIPQLEEELRAEDVQLRVLATKVLGQMFADKSSSLSSSATAGESSDLARRYAGTWRAWLGRANDKSSSLRVVWAECLKPILVNHPELSHDLTPIVENKLLEPDERVRAATAKMLGSLDYETALHHVDKSVLLKLADRCKDKKTLVRKASLEAVGKLFDMAYSEIDNNDPAAIQQFAWIPQEVFKCLYAGQNELQVLVAATVEKYILPLPANLEEDEAAWTHRLLLVMKYLEPEATKAMLRLTNLTIPRPSLHDRFLDCCEQYNGGEVASDKDSNVVKIMMADRIRRCAALMADVERAKTDLHAFAKLNDTRIYKLLRTCLDAQSDLKTTVKSRNDALRRIENANATIVDTFAVFIRSGGYFILNRSSVPTLIRKLSHSTRGKASQGSSEASGSDAETHRASAQELLEFIAKKCPAMLAMHAPELCKALFEEANAMLVQTCLQALAAVAQWNTSKVQLDKKAVERLAKLVLKGTPLQAKYAAKLLAIVATGGAKGGRKAGGPVSSSAAFGVLEEVLDSLAKHLGSAKPERQVAMLHSLAQLFKHAPDASENISSTVVRTILSDILLKPLAAGKVKAYANAGEDWVDDAALASDYELHSKLLALTVLTRRCEAFGKTDSAADLAKPIFRLLWAVVSAGEAKALATPAAVKSRMRLQAALCVLKLARHASYDACIGREYLDLAFVVQDESFNVRSRVLHKLLSYLQARRIDARFVAMSFLAAYDPEEENRNMVLRYCQSTCRALPAEQRLKYLDTSLPRLIHVLAHHPDFSRESRDALLQFTRYLSFFLDAVASAANVGVLFYLATRVKGVRDAETQTASENLYALSELAQLVIKKRAIERGWTIESYPGKITLPGDIFKPLPSREVQREIYDRQYLPADLVRQLSDAKPKASKATGVGKFSISLTGAGARKRKQTKASASGKVGRKTKKPKRKVDSDNDDDDNVDDASGDESPLSSDPESSDLSEEDE